MKEMLKKRKNFQNLYVKQGTMLFTVGALLILLFYLINNVPIIKKGIGTMNDILMPFYIGVVMAYLLCPIYNSVVRLVYKLSKGKCKTSLKDLNLARGVATFVTLALAVGIFVGFVMMIAPGIWDSIMVIVPKVEPAFGKITEWIQRNLEANPELANLMEGKIDNLSETLIDWLQQNILPGAEALITSVSTGVIGTIGTIVDILVALIICIYILNSKETFMAQTKKIILAIFSEKRAESFFQLGTMSNETFGAFINGKIIDSLIVGVLCFVSMLLLGLPLPILISVIICITNIIPFFGPFIGAIPSTLLVLMLEPSQWWKFVLLIIILQQLDGNVIGPKILGKATKLSSFWVMFAIVVAGGLFGFPGWVLGVPVFAIIYSYIARAVSHRLAKKELETDTLKYADFSKYNIDKEEVFGRGVRKNDEGPSEEPKECISDHKDN